jgi:cytochrome P450 family 6
MMFSTIDQVSIQLMSTIEERLSKSNNYLDAKDVLARFTTDVIGNTAFGLECNSLNNKESKFYEMGTDILVPRSSIFERFLRNTFKSLARKFHVKLIPDHIANFYMDVTKETVSYREKNPHIKRQDFMNLLVELKQKNVITVEQIAAQSFIFFLAGYETTSSTMTFCLYELAIDEEIQEKARESVKNVLKKHDNKFTYEAISEMEYLEQCVNETLRKYPVVTNLQRVNNKPVQLASTKITLPANQAIWIPVHAIHYDPEIYPDPQKFDPDRFSEEEISKRDSMSFLPFGIKIFVHILKENYFVLSANYI